MPGMDGFETAAMIHQHPRFERTPIIFVTGVRDSELDRLKGCELGAVAYVSIPVVPEVLRGKVSVLVELHCKRLELQALNARLAEANAKLARANQALEADRQKDEFLAILAHELRNPLAPIRNAIEIMARIPIEEPRLRWCRDVIDRQALHLTRLVDDLLDISRITRGTIKLARELVGVDLLVGRAIEALQPLLTEQRHVLSVDCPDAGWTVRGDPTRLVQVLGNLLNNAARYTDPGGAIALTVRRVDDSVEIAVRDNGIGIDEAAQARLFQLFSRLDAGYERAPGGLGIGLALVRRLVEMHAGRVSVASEGPGHGSEFRVRLPLADEAPLGRDRSALPAPARRRRRVLVADDNADALESLALLLECDGYEVRRASNGAEACDVAMAWRPEAALLDLGMPVMDGYEAATFMRSESWGTEMRIVAISGWGQGTDLERSRTAGFDAHLVKPVTFESLTRSLQAPPNRSRRTPIGSTTG